MSISAPAKTRKQSLLGRATAVIVYLFERVMPDPFVRIVPAWLPAPLALVLVSGVFEILGGVGLLVPRARRAASFGLVALYLAVFPANVNMAIHHLTFDGVTPIPPALLWGRLPFQILFIAWALWGDPVVLAAAPGHDVAALPSVRALLRTRAPAPDLAPLSVGGPTLSLLLPVHDPDPELLRATLASVQTQSEAGWQLCVVDDGSADPEVLTILRDTATDPRVHLQRHDDGAHPPAAGAANDSRRCHRRCNGHAGRTAGGQQSGADATDNHEHAGERGHGPIGCDVDTLRNRGFTDNFDAKYQRNEQFGTDGNDAR